MSTSIQIISQLVSRSGRGITLKLDRTAISTPTPEEFRSLRKTWKSGKISAFEISLLRCVSVAMSKSMFWSFRRCSNSADLNLIPCRFTIRNLGAFGCTLEKKLPWVSSVRSHYRLGLIWSRMSWSMEGMDGW